VNNPFQGAVSERMFNRLSPSKNPKTPVITAQAVIDFIGVFCAGP
jgi:hypothetical protein